MFIPNPAARIIPIVNRSEKLLSLAVTALFLSPLICAQAPRPDPAYVREVQHQRAEQLQDLKDNWIPLAGLFWLKPGTNSFGTDASNDIVLPPGTAPASAGVFDRNGDTVTVTLKPGASATIDGRPVTTAALQSDASGKPTILALGRLQMHVVKRQQRLGIRLKDLENPALRSFHPLIYFPIQPGYRVQARWLPAEKGKTINQPDVLGDTTAVPVAGVAQFSLNGQQFTLTPTGGDPAKSLFFVFSDLTSKTDTYPSGRFLDTGPVKDGAIVLDFNTAYNPPCAFTAFATCPLPPKENRLPIAIPAGEKYDRKHGHH
jgi:uncharacterized protein (DUF1684 family)